MATNPFANVITNAKGANDRHFGGTGDSIVADPYISGYHYIQFVKLPEMLKSEYVKHGDGAVAGSKLSGDMESFLAGSCLAVTPPGGTINKTEFTGIGGVKWAVPTNMDYNTSVTVKFLEFSSLPVLSIIHGWCKLIRDYKTGLTGLNTQDDAYTKSAYSASMFYWTTKPDGKTIEYSACYTGMFPTKDPQDLFTGDLTAVDKLEIDVEFNVDWIWHETWVHDACKKYADQRNNKVIGGYRDSSGGKDSTAQ